MDRTPGNSLAVGVAGAAASIGLAAALVPLRTTLGTANTALIIVLVVIAAAAAGGFTAGAITSVVGALSFNFFHTKPYLTMRIDAGHDVLTVILIVIIGLAVGELAVLRAQAALRSRTQIRATRSLETIGAMVSAGASAAEVWPALREELTTTLGLRDADYDGSMLDPALPVIQRDGRIESTQHHYTGAGFALPPTGVQVPVEAEGRLRGRLVLLPDPMVAVSRDQRRAVVAMADQFALALGRGPLVDGDS